MKTESGQVVRLKDYRPTPYAIATVDLDVQLDPAETIVHSRLAFSRRDGTDAGTPLVLDGDELTLVAAAIDGRPLKPDAFLATPDGFTLLAPPAEPFLLELTTRIAPAANTKLMGLYRTSSNYCTQCEAEGFRRITYFLDRPDVLAKYTTRIEARKAEAPVLLSNGNLIAAGDLPGTDRHFAIWHDPFFKPSYLFALVAGDLAVAKDSFITCSGRTVDLRIYVEHGKEGRVAYAMDSLKRSMRWDEQAFGREYDLDIFMIVAVSDFNMGAMENKGLNVFNDKYVLADPDTATDADYAGIEAVIAHEYFHNWTGNRITCRDWFQLCVKEGLTVFRDQEFSSDQRSRPVKRISDVRGLRAMQFAEDAGPLAHPVRPDSYREINNFYTATVYEKGAEVIRALKTLIGPEKFRAGMDLYFARHDGEATTVETFVSCFAEVTGRDLGAFFRWYVQSGTPVVTATSSYDPVAQTLTLNLSQTCPPTPGQPEKLPYVVPVRFGLVGPNGEDMTYDGVAGATVSGDVIELTEATQTVVFSGLGARPVPSLLRGFSAPVRLQDDLTEADRLFLMRQDADPFNRWQAAQALGLGAVLAAVAAVRAGQPVADQSVLADAFGEVMEATGLDEAFRALVLTLPGESDIAREIGSDVDPAAIATARLAVRRAIALQLADRIRTSLDAVGPEGAFSPDAASAGRRSFRNVLLDLLATTGEAEALARVEAHFNAARTMTDRIAALSTLVVAGAPAAPTALAAYYARHAGDALAIDKWLTVQATAPQADTLDQVRALTSHPAFSFQNPNRVRALIGAFASGNPVQFNRADGAGYGFVADTVLFLDKANPQVAARLLAAFRSWRALEPGRRALAEAALRRVADAPELSRDVADIATRSLA